MRIIGKDGKEYKSEKECLAADKKYDEMMRQKKCREEQERKALEEKIAKEKAELGARKKEKAKSIEDATEKLEYFKKEYEVAKIEAKKLIEEANKQAEDMLKAVAKKVEEASAERMNAIAEFNKEFGPYQTTLTGNDALNEYNKIVKQFNDTFFDRFFPITWRI